MFCFIETKLFSKLRSGYLSNEEYRQVQFELIGNPEAGAVIRGSGGIRKLRLRAPGRGKSGGYRLIYFLRRNQGVIWMLTIYPKSVRDSIPGHILNQIRMEIESEQE
jgi:mRNA-degrading endonuclease RelE of RelBE toxin-antitoxin system